MEELNRLEVELDRIKQMNLKNKGFMVHFYSFLFSYYCTFIITVLV